MQTCDIAEKFAARLRVAPTSWRADTRPKESDTRSNHTQDADSNPEPYKPGTDKSYEPETLGTKPYKPH